MAGVTRVGAEIQVNTDSTDYPYGNAPTVVKMANGGFMILWSEGNFNKPGGNAADPGDVRAQIFSATGAKVGTEFVVNTTTAGLQGLPKAALLTDGTIFVTWQDSSGTGGDATGSAVKGQLLNATGAKVGGEILVNTTTAGNQQNAAVTALANGNVMVAWNDTSATGGDTSMTAIRAQVLTPSGTKVGGEFLVNTNTTGSQVNARMATLPNGNVVIVWDDLSGTGLDASGNSVHAQLVDSTGAKVGGEFLVNTTTTGSQGSGGVTALANGGFVVSWTDASGTGGDTDGGIKAQLFDAAGNKVGGEFLVNTMTAGAQGSSAITTLDNGDFVITWLDSAVPGTPSRQDLRGQLFSSTGTKIGGEFLADSPVPNLVEGAPGIVAIGDGKFVVASVSSLYQGEGQDQLTRGVKAQILAGSRDLSGTSGNNALVGAAGADTFFASPGHDTIDGRGGSTDRVVINADDHSLWAVTTGSVSYTWSGASLTNSLGTLDTTLTAVEQVELYDTSAASHTLNFSVTLAGRMTVVFGNGDDHVVGGANLYADLGLGNNTISGDSSPTSHDFVALTVQSGSSLVTVNDITRGISVGYTTAAGSALTTITDAESYYIIAAAGQGLKVDASESLANSLSLQDSPFDDILIGSSGSNTFVSLGSGPPAATDLSTGTDYKTGNGGADTYDYSVAMPTAGVDHIMDLDSDDILDFSFYNQAGSIRNGITPVFIGTDAFHHVQNEYRYEKVGGKTYIYTDTDGDGVANGTVVIENGAFDLALYPNNPNGGENVLRITLAQNFVNGTTGTDVQLNSTTGNDVVRAYQGDDTIRASTGQDFVDGGAGFDTLTATIGNTTGTPYALPAQGTADTYVIGADRLYDTAGTVNTSFLGIERVQLDFQVAGNGFGSVGHTYDAHLFGGRVELTLGGGDDVAIGTAKDDTFDGGQGNDRFYGGAGNDTYYVDSQNDLVFENAFEGSDTVYSYVSYYLYAGIENLTLQASAGDAFGVGNELANMLRGNAGNNTLIAGEGADRVDGLDGNDIIYGQGGLDNLYGEGGNDFIAGGDGNDIINGDEGGDSIYGEAGDDNLTGGSDFFFDQLVGGDGNDTLHGDSGQADYDYLYGNAGDDKFYVDTGDDLTFEQAGEGTDTVYANVPGANNGVYLYANIENLVLLGTTTFGVGNTQANQLTGNAVTNLLLGGDGNDTINGKGGNDVLFGQAGNDTFVFEHGTGGDVIGDFTAGSDKIDLVAIGYTWTQVQNSMHQNGSDLAIDLGNGDLIVLQGVNSSQLHQSDFILASGASAVEPVTVAPDHAAIDNGLASRLWHGHADLLITV